MGNSFSTFEIILIFIGILVFILSILFTAVEEALSRFNYVKLESVSEGLSDKKNMVLNKLVSESNLYISSLRFLSTITQFIVVSIFTYFAIAFFRSPWSIIIVSLSILFVFVFSEATARTLAILNTEKTLVGFAKPASAFADLAPIKFVVKSLIGFANAIVPGGSLKEGPFTSPEELIALADVAVKDEILDPQERDLIESVIEFGDTIVREVMVPRTDMVACEVSNSISEVLNLATDVGYSRLPVIRDTIDDVAGLVYVKDLIKAEIDSDDHLLNEYLRPAMFVPESKNVSELLKEMQKEKFHMAVAIDEYGGVAGLVTMEDLVEEIVGEIVDEYDNEEALVERQKDGTLRVAGKIGIDELNDLSDFDLPTGDWDTVAGLVFDTFGRIPNVGETCEVDGVTLCVERIQGRRITRVSIISA